MTFDLFGDTSNTQSSHQLIQLPGAELLFLPALFEQQEADALLVDLTHNIAWQQESISLYGQQHLLPRLTAWYGDEGSRYQYSAVNLHALPWTPTLLSIKQRMEAHSDGVQFNSVSAQFVSQWQRWRGLAQRQRSRARLQPHYRLRQFRTRTPLPTASQPRQKLEIFSALATRQLAHHAR
jgi:hypothetical protein